MLNSSNMATTAAVTAIVVLGIYRRVRRNIGRQTLTAGRQYFLMALFTILCLVLTFIRPLQPLAIAYIASGLIVGAAVGWFALRYTEFESTAEGYFYTPHLYIGLAVTALFIGRLLYRVALVYDRTSNGAVGTPHMGDNNPLTLGILFLTAAYYIVYCTGLLRWLRKAQQSASAKLPPEAPDGASSNPI
ncbi:MAG TPA: hypothetical protein VGM97_09355 [Steroidobacteraceae bacterium]|jgi:hypothetical protein